MYTPEELRDILDTAIEPPLGTHVRHIENALGEIRRNIFFQLINSKDLPPSSQTSDGAVNDNKRALWIDLLKKEIYSQTSRSLIDPGYPIGMTIGESHGQPLTQLSLNSFHTTTGAGGAGTSGLGEQPFYTVNDGTLPAFNQLINMTKTKDRRDVKSWIHFNRDMKESDVILFRNMIVNKTLEEFLINGSRTSGSTIVYFDDSQVVGGSDEPIFEPWYPVFFKKYGAMPANVRKDMAYRLMFDPYKLFLYRKPLFLIGEMLRSMCYCVWSQTTVGYIDIFFHETSSAQTKQKLISSIMGILVSGVTRITNVVPRFVGVLDALEVRNPGSIKPLFGSTEGELVIFVKTIVLRHIPIETVLRKIFLENPNVETYRYIPRDIKGQTLDDLTSFYNGCVIFKLKFKKEEGTPVMSQSSEEFRLKLLELHAETKYFFAETTGSNLIEVMRRPDVNRLMTISNDPHEINEVIGLEAARNWLENEFCAFFGNGSRGGISPKHYSAIPDFMTNKGILSAVTSKGILRERRGFYSNASFDNVMKALGHTATFGRKEPVTSTSSCILMGKACSFGTGAFKVIIKDQSSLPQRASAGGGGSTFIEEVPKTDFVARNTSGAISVSVEPGMADKIIAETINAAEATAGSALRAAPLKGVNPFLQGLGVMPLTTTAAGVVRQGLRGQRPPTRSPSPSTRLLAVSRVGNNVPEISEPNDLGTQPTQRKIVSSLKVIQTSRARSPSPVPARAPAPVPKPKGKNVRKPKISDLPSGPIAKTQERNSEAQGASFLPKFQPDELDF